MAKKSLIAKAKRKPHHPVQGYNRCYICGRPRGYMRRFGLCREERLARNQGPPGDDPLLPVGTGGTPLRGHDYVLSIASFGPLGTANRPPDALFSALACR